MCIQVYECIYTCVGVSVCVCNIRNEQISYYYPVGVGEGADRGEGMSIRTAVARASPSDNRVCRVYRTFSPTAPSSSPLVPPYTRTRPSNRCRVRDYSRPTSRFTDPRRPSVFRHARQSVRQNLRAYG